MLRPALTLAALAAIGLAPATAAAAAARGSQSGYVRYSHRGPEGYSRGSVSYSHRSSYQDYAAYPQYRSGGYYGGYYGYGRGYGYRPGGRGYSSNSFSAAARRVQAKYSTYRYSPHPRSQYKSGPHRYDYRGW